MKTFETPLGYHETPQKPGSVSSLVTRVFAGFQVTPAGFPHAPPFGKQSNNEHKNAPRCLTVALSDHPPTTTPLGKQNRQEMKIENEE